MPTHHPQHDERAFGVIELIIALAIVGVLLGILIASFGGAKASTRSGEAKIAASAYEEAIAKFQTDNANSLPPAGQMTQISGFPAGPRNALAGNKPYLAGLPSGVAEGRVGVSMDGSSCSGAPTGGAASTALGWVAYCPEPAPNFGIRVLTRPQGASWTDPATKTCWRGNTAKTPRCG